MNPEILDRLDACLGLYAYFLWRNFLPCIRKYHLFGSAEKIDNFPIDMKPGSFTIVYTACPSIVAKIRMGCSALFLSTYFPVSPHPCRRRSHWLAWPKLAVKTVNWKLFFLLINCILNAYYELSFIQYSFVLYLPSISVEIFILRRSFVSSF